MNSVQIIGNISTDIDAKITPQGHHVAKFNVAVTNPYNRDKTSFLPVEVWRKQAENVSNYCQKGSKVGIVGHIEVDQYEKDGQKRTFTKIVAANVEFLTPKSAGNDSGNNSRNTSGQQGQQQPNNSGYSKTNDDPFAGGDKEPFDPNDDLPF